jgi:hypothetical protein
MGEQRMRAKQTICLLIVEIGISWLLTGCHRTPTTEPGFIRYEMDRIPYHIINHSPDEIEVLEPEQSYTWTQVGWQRDYWCLYCIGIPDEVFKIGKLVPSGNDWPDEGGPRVFTCAADRKCDNLMTRRYRVPELPGHTFVIYSNEGRAGDPSRAEGSQLKVSFLPSNPFSLTIHSEANEAVWLCWTRVNKLQEVAWGQDSRLERQTEHGTWEIMSHTLDLCKAGTDSGIQIPPRQSVTVDGTMAYPNYAQLPPGTYRWVITLNHLNAVDHLIFSPRFQWGNQP